MRIENLNTYLATGLVIILIIIGGLYYFFQQTPNAKLVIGAGAPDSESYQFVQAIKLAAEHHFPNLEIEVKVTEGSEENINLLENGEIDLGTVQADIIQTNLEAGAKTRIVGILYEDIYQLIVRKESNIQSVFDLKGKRIVLPRKGSGQWRSFWFIANHYGLKGEDLIDFEQSTKVGNQAILSGEIDAAFRVRSARNEEIQELINAGAVKIVPIDQAKSLVLQLPVCKETFLPKGAYSASPMVPQEDLTTLAVDRYLLANEKTDAKAVAAIVKILFERRLELQLQTPLAGFISRPNLDAGTLVPVHEGALTYYNRNEPSFIVDKADFIALLISIFVLFGSALIGLRRRWKEKQKNTIDGYTIDLMDTMKSVSSMHSLEALENCKANLRTTLDTIIHKLDEDEINFEGFQFFSFVWDATIHAIEEQKHEIEQRNI